MQALAVGWRVREALAGLTQGQGALLVLERLASGRRRLHRGRLLQKELLLLLLPLGQGARAAGGG